MDRVEAEFDEMDLQIEWEKANVTMNVLDLVKTRPNLHRTLCGILIQACGQWTGINVNNYYGPTIYARLGFTGDKILMINGIHGAWCVIVILVTINFVVDRIGRRVPMLVGALGCAACLAWQAGCSSQFARTGYHNSNTGNAGVTSNFFFSTFFNMTWGTISWIYQSEIFPMPIRSMGVAVSTSANWLNNLIISQITPSAFAHIGWKYFLVFMCCNLSNFAIVWFLFPETKGRTLEEIGTLFGDTNVVVGPELMKDMKEEGDKGELSHMENVAATQNN